jgi:phosphohistidine phosphatase
MKLYVMRHGPAEDEAKSGRDADRTLTPLGRDRTRSVATALLDEGEAPFVVISSPLVRALQTAEIVAAVTKLDERVRSEKKARASGATGAVEIRREMAPAGHPLALVRDLLRGGRERVMIVGHEPDLSLLVERLIGGGVLQGGMLKSMVVGVKLTPANPSDTPDGFRASLRFVLDPKTVAWHRP